MIERYLHLTLKVLTQIYPDKKAQIDKLVISFEFQDPFPEDATKNWTGISALYNGGVISLETAVTMLALTDAPEDEIAKIQQAALDKIAAENAAKEGTKAE